MAPSMAMPRTSNPAEQRQISQRNKEDFLATLQAVCPFPPFDRAAGANRVGSGCEIKAPAWITPPPPAAGRRAGCRR